MLRLVLHTRNLGDKLLIASQDEQLAQDERNNLTWRPAYYMMYVTERDETEKQRALSHSIGRIRDARLSFTVSIQGAQLNSVLGRIISSVPTDRGLFTLVTFHVVTIVVSHDIP